MAKRTVKLGKLNGNARIGTEPQSAPEPAEKPRELASYYAPATIDHKREWIQRDRDTRAQKAAEIAGKEKLTADGELADEAREVSDLAKLFARTILAYDTAHNGLSEARRKLRRCSSRWYGHRTPLAHERNNAVVALETTRDELWRALPVDVRNHLRSARDIKGSSAHAPIRSALSGKVRELRARYEVTDGDRARLVHLDKRIETSERELAEAIANVISESVARSIAASVPPSAIKLLRRFLEGYKPKLKTARGKLSTDIAHLVRIGAMEMGGHHPRVPHDRTAVASYICDSAPVSARAAKRNAVRIGSFRGAFKKRERIAMARLALAWGELDDELVLTPVPGCSFRFPIYSTDVRSALLTACGKDALAAVEAADKADSSRMPKVCA